MSDEASAHRDPRSDHLSVPRSARVWTWGPDEADDIWIVLHGYRQLAGRFIRRFEPLVASGVRVIAPEGLSRFYLDEAGGSHGPEARIGATWMTREDREAEIRDYVGYLDRVHRSYCVRPGASSVRVTVLGFSQGVHTASRWLSFGTPPLDRIVLWGARLPSDLDLASVADRWTRTEVVLVHGETDRFDSAAGRARDDALLHEIGVEGARYAHPQGHRIDAEVLRTLR